MLKVGEVAPEIDAVTTDGSRFVLSRASSLCTVVYFFPKAFTPGCTVETQHFRDNRAELVLAGANVIGISADDVETQCRFAEKLNTRFPLIADPEGKLTRAYGVNWPLIGIARRVTFIIGEERRVLSVFKHRTFMPIGKDDPLAFVDGVLSFVHALRAGSRPDSG